MRKIFVSVGEAMAGMKMAETIFNDYGAVIVSEDTILDNHIIGKIRNLGINKIKIHDSSNDNIVISGAELFQAQYNKNVDVLKDMLHDISVGKDVEITTVNEVSESIITRINENRDIVNCINHMRNADEYTYSHSVNVSLLCMLIGKWLRFDFYKVKELVQTGLMHDLGKGKIPMEVLHKPGALSADEFEEVKKHTLYGYKIAESIPNISDNILKGILMHHEREDGSGYPFNMKGTQIHEFAKIVAVADIYDAMTSNRPYKHKESPFDVFELMEKDSIGKLDQRIISTFLKNIGAYYIGDFVKMSTGDIGEIIYINPMHVSQPIVRVNDNYLDLSKEKNLKIMELI